MKKILFNDHQFKTKVIIAVCIAILWCLVYCLNDWLFSNFVFVQNAINWVFLPAAVRVLAVLLAGWVGVFGLFFGSIVTSTLVSFEDPMVTPILVLATISSMTPMLGLLVCTRGLKINNNLQGLSASNLLLICATIALLSVLAHNLAYYYFGHTVNILGGIVPMFVGDFLGMLIVLYVVKLTLPKKAKLRNQAFS